MANLLTPHGDGWRGCAWRHLRELVAHLLTPHGDGWLLTAEAACVPMVLS